MTLPIYEVTPLDNRTRYPTALPFINAAGLGWMLEYGARARNLQTRPQVMRSVASLSGARAKRNTDARVKIKETRRINRYFAIPDRRRKEPPFEYDGSLLSQACAARVSTARVQTC